MKKQNKLLFSGAALGKDSEFRYQCDNCKGYYSLDIYIQTNSCRRKYFKKCMECRGLCE